MDTTAKWLIGAAIPAMQIAWLRYVGHFGWVCALYVPKHGFEILQSKRPRIQMLRATCLLVSTSLNFVALEHLPLTITIAIFFLAPLTVCLLSIPVLGERVGIKRLLAVLIGFSGILIIVQPWSESFNPYVFFSIGAMLGASLYFVLSRIVAGVDSNATTQFIVSGSAPLLLAPFAIHQWVWPTDPPSWILLVLIGSLGMLGHSMVTNAHRFAQASVLAPIIYSQAVFIAILSWVVFSQPPDLKTVIGTFIIVGSGLFVWWRERQLKG
jgi:drug/metabolite transporter (DMT)-like permease